MVLCHISATPASCTCCSHGLLARWGGGGQGAESWADGPGGGGSWILFPPEQMRGWLLLELPAPGSQGWDSLQGLLFRASVSLGIFPRGIPGLPGDWEQLDSVFPVPQ